MEIRNTATGRMFKVTLEWSPDAKSWIREKDIIGFQESLWDSKMHYYIRTDFIIGAGINGVDQLLEITKEDYDEIIKEMGLM